MSDMIEDRAADGAAGSASGPPAGNVAEAAALDDTTLAAFVAEHYERLLRLAWLVTRDATLTADAVQAGLEQAWRNRSKLRDGRRLRPWLDRIVVRESIRIGKRRRGWLRRVLSQPEPSEAWIDVAHTGRLPSAEWIAFRAAFGRLPSEQRAVVALHLYAGYSVAETAHLVGARIGTVRSRLRLARQRLRRDVEEGHR
jgi:RNA polymerase sigma-70 factor (ECF subfamily)